jgi:hypothetical protein
MFPANYFKKITCQLQQNRSNQYNTKAACLWFSWSLHPQRGKRWGNPAARSSAPSFQSGSSPTSSPASGVWSVLTSIGSSSCLMYCLLAAPPGHRQPDLQGGAVLGTGQRQRNRAVRGRPRPGWFSTALTRGGRAARSVAARGQRN